MIPAAHCTWTRTQMKRLAPLASVPDRSAVTLLPELPMVQPAASPAAEAKVSCAGRASVICTLEAAATPALVIVTLY